MRRLFAALALSVPLLVRGAGDTFDFEFAAFRAAVPENSRKSAVFSPLSFVIDVAALGEASDTLTRSAVAETLGTLSDFESSYAVALTNVFAARALVLPSFRDAPVAFRAKLAGGFGIQTCARRTVGAEAYLKAMMDGELDAAVLPEDRPGLGCQLFDMVSAGILPAEPFCERVGMTFACADGTERKVGALTGRVACDLRDCGIFTVIRLPLANESELILVHPAVGVQLGDVNAALTGSRFRDILASLGGVTDLRVSHEVCELTLPEFDFTAETDLLPALTRFKVPLQGFKRLAEGIRVETAVQYVRARLVVTSSTGVRADDRAEPPAQRYLLDHPFVFFVRHAPTGMFKAAGQYTGLN